MYDLSKDMYYYAKHLKKLDLNNQNRLCDSHMSIKKPNLHPAVSPLNMYYCNYAANCLVIWPPKLEWLGMSNAGATFLAVPNTTFWNNGSMKYIDVSNNKFETFPNYLQCGIFTHNIISTIEHIDVSNCGMKCASKDLAGYCTFSVKYLNVSHNKLGLLEGGCNKNPKMEFLAFIKKFTMLEIFDVSYNNISFLPDDSDIFEAGINLKEVILSNNNLLTLKPANLSKLVSLELLDLSYNQFHSIPKKTWVVLNNLDDRLQQRNSSHFSLNLLGNPLFCTCHFIEWLKITKITIKNRNQYTCSYRNGTMKMSDQILYKLKLECTEKTWFYFISGYLAIYFILVAVATTCYRYRYNFQYLLPKMRMHQERLRHFIAKRRMRQEQLDASLARKEEYHYDAFISCTREGAKWIKRHFIPRFENDELGLKFCIAQRDFLVGKTIIDNIIDSIRQSRKTILLVDRTFINSKWCQEELLLSHHVSDLM